jgi:hypothetical protein
VDYPQRPTLVSFIDGFGAIFTTCWILRQIRETTGVSWTDRNSVSESDSHRI